MNPPLILLFGMPRSGTTWLGKIFDSHPDTLYRHEPDSKGTLNQIPLFPIVSDKEKYRLFLEKYIQNLPAIQDEKVSASLPIFPKSYYKPYQLVLRKTLIFGIKVTSRIFGSLPVPNIVNIARNRQISIVWKSIESLGRLGVLCQLFPEIRTIIILRHPCGYVSSVFRGEAQHKFESNAPSSQDWDLYRLMLETPAAKKRGLDLATIQAMNPMERLALKWALYYEQSIQETAGLDNVIIVKYEDLCEHPEIEARKIFNHCNLPWSDNTNKFIFNSTSYENSNYFSIFKNSKESAYKWQKELTLQDVDQIMNIAARFKASTFYLQSKINLSYK